MNVEWLQPMLQRVMEVRTPCLWELDPLQEMPSVFAAFTICRAELALQVASGSAPPKRPHPSSCLS